jgi:hypothetical protein
VQELPRLDNGKLYKRYLQQQYRDKATLLSWLGSGREGIWDAK